MTASEYYYGKTFETWENLPYFEAIEVRRDCAKGLYHKLWKEMINSDKELPFDKRVRLWKVEKAWKDNQKLLDERDNLI